MASTTDTPVRFTVAETGCVLDGANRGWRIGADAIEYAGSWGFPVSAVDTAVIVAYRASEDPDGTVGDYVQSMADEAIEWLNEHTVDTEECSFGWHEGSLMLWSAEDWQRWD
jgi:hypothetical protein